MLEEAERRETVSRWTLITNHGACLIYVAEHPRATVREIAQAVDVTERATARILRDLRNAGYLAAQRVGRRNVYHLDASMPLRHPVGDRRLVRDFLAGLRSAGDGQRDGGLAAADV